MSSDVDRTPEGYSLPSKDRKEYLKRPLRLLFYPLLNAVVSPFLAFKYSTGGTNFDLWLWGQRGNDYERNRRRVDKFLRIKGSRVLVAGCGTGRDLESWVQMRPRQLIGVDLFRYDRAWGLQKNKLRSISPDTNLEFLTSDLRSMPTLLDSSVDIVGSDAVFEHLRDLDGVLLEFRRVLRPGGILYATFGPLWHGWGGDHVSGYDGIEHGFNHLLLPTDEWMRYVDNSRPSSHSEDDGRTWIRHDMFSRLRVEDYLRKVSRHGFSILFSAAIIDPRAVKFLRSQRDDTKRLMQDHSVQDLVICGMSIIAIRV